MEEAFTQSAGKLAPLLILLGVVFGALIVVALVLRSRVRRDTGGQPVRRRESATEVQADDMLSVLGRTFSVRSVERLPLADGEALWCELASDDDPARLALAADLGWAIQFPGRSEASADDPFPERIERDGMGFTREGEPLQLGQGLRLARYKGAKGRWLAVEQRGADLTLWRGKEIPVEGVSVMEDQG